MVAPQPDRADTATAPTKPQGLALVIQVFAFIISLGLLGWCVWLVAGDPAKRAQAERLLHAPVEQLVLVVALSLVTVMMSGLVFWAMGRPLNKVTAIECIGVNGVCSLLSYLPMKASLIFRFLYHRRANSMEWLTITAWLGAVASLIVLSLLPGLVATLLLKDVNLLWWVMTVGGLVGVGVLLPLLAGLFAGEAGLERFRSLARATRLRLVMRLVDAAFFKKLHAGLALLASRPGVWLALLFRAIDIAAQSARFWFIAGIIQVEVTPAQCILAGTAYFFIQATSPAGVAGPREGGLIALLGTSFGPVVLAVTAAEAAANLILGLTGAAFLRLDRLFGFSRSTTPAARSATATDAATATATQADTHR